MHQSLTASSFVLICVFVTLASVGQIFIKKSVSGGSLVGGSPGKTLKNIFGALRHPYALIGFGLYVISTFVWLLVLSKVRLSVAYPMMSLSYFLVVILSATVLREKVDKRFAIAGLLLISAGVACVGFGMVASILQMHRVLSRKHEIGQRVPFRAFRLSCFRDCI